MRRVLVFLQMVFIIIFCASCESEDIVEQEFATLSVSVTDVYSGPITRSANSEGILDAIDAQMPTVYELVLINENEDVIYFNTNDEITIPVGEYYIQGGVSPKFETLLYDGCVRLADSPYLYIERTKISVKKGRNEYKLHANLECYAIVWNNETTLTPEYFTKYGDNGYLPYARYDGYDMTFVSLDTGLNRSYPINLVVYSTAGSTDISVNGQDGKYYLIDPYLTPNFQVNRDYWEEGNL